MFCETRYGTLIKYDKIATIVIRPLRIEYGYDCRIAHERNTHRETQYGFK